jgi:hypothetical protein
MEVSFPHARTLLYIRSWRKVGGQEGRWEDRYYLSSLESGRKMPEQWAHSVREHWGGVESRNHWRKDACLLEDKTRSRNPNIVPHHAAKCHLPILCPDRWSLPLAASLHRSEYR